MIHEPLEFDIKVVVNLWIGRWLTFPTVNYYVTFKLIHLK